MNLKKFEHLGVGGRGVHQLNNNKLFNLQLFADTIPLNYNKVDNPYIFYLNKPTWIKGDIKTQIEYNLVEYYKKIPNYNTITILPEENADYIKEALPNVTSCEQMMGHYFLLFGQGCKKLTSIDTTGWDTSNVTNMNGMFSSCNALTTLDVSKFNTSKVTDMGYMFQCCSGLTTIDVSKWTTNNVTNMSYMFNLCSSLTALDVSGWDTSKVTDMNTMFQVCSGLTNLDVSDWNTSNVTNMERLFNVCSGLTEIDVSNWNTSKVTNMECMFLQCRNVKMLDVSKWDVSKVTKFAEMFGECYSLTELDLSGWDLSSCEEDDVHLFSDIQGSENRRNGDLTTIKLGKGFFKAKTKEYTSANLTTINWSRESMMESLYTNQIGRDVTDVKNLYLRPEPLSRLSEEDIAKIKSVGIILIKATSGG